MNLKFPIIFVFSAPFALGLGAVGGATPAFAQGAPETFEECAVVPDDVERLACYDEVAFAKTPDTITAMRQAKAEQQQRDFGLFTPGPGQILDELAVVIVKHRLNKLRKVELTTEDGAVWVQTDAGDDKEPKTMNATGNFSRKFAGRVIAPAAAAVLMVIFAALPATVQAAPCAAASVAERAGRAFVRAASSRSASAFAGALRSHADMRGISMFALGKHRKKLPKSAESEYVKLTGRYVAKTLANFSKKFRAESVTAVRCRGATVETKLNQLGGRPPQKVLFRIKGGKVRDVNVQNVWLGQLLRSNFNSVIKKGGGKISALFRLLGARKSFAAKLDVK